MDSKATAFALGGVVSVDARSTSLESAWECSSISSRTASRNELRAERPSGTVHRLSKRTFSLQSNFVGSPRTFAKREKSRRTPSSFKPRSQAAGDAAVAEKVPEIVIPTITVRENVRNIAIIAHVDHGKTTLVDAMLKQARVWRDNQAHQERIMDSNDLERERGITILAKNTAIMWGERKINIMDTPGHADFGGEVERVLNMADGALLLVDAVEGPMPQTRFVLRKALELGLKVLLVVNKVDRPQSRPDYVVNKTFDLFCDLGATDYQADFATVFCVGLTGSSGSDPTNLQDDLVPLFDEIVKLPPPKVIVNGPLQMMVTSLDYDEHRGRIAIGRVLSGTISKGKDVVVCTPDTIATPKKGRISDLFAFENLGRVPIASAEAGDIVALTGFDDIAIGETVCEKDDVQPLPPLTVEEPTVRMEFMVNTSPFAGREGTFVTSRMVRDRLFKELEKNVSLRVEDTDSSDTFLVSGRGGLHLAILIETMRREGFEFQVGSPSVITKQVDGETHEPYEDVYVEVPTEHVGAIVDMLSKRKGQMINMHAGETGNMTYIHYLMPTRGLLGLRNSLLTATKGTAVLNSLQHGYLPFAGPIEQRDQGSLISMETGTTTTYALQKCQDRGALFIDPGCEVYEGMIVGIHQRPGDLPLNVCRAKQVTNMRAASKEITIKLLEPVRMSLDDAIEYIGRDELVEITPKNIRLAKKDRQNSLKQKSSKGR